MGTPRKSAKVVSGKPRTPDDQLRRKSLTIYLTDEQHANLERLSKALGYVYVAELGRLSIEAFLGCPGLLGPEQTNDGESVLRHVARLVVAGIISLGKTPMTDEELREAIMPKPHPPGKTFPRLIA